MPRTSRSRRSGSRASTNERKHGGRRWQRPVRSAWSCPVGLVAVDRDGLALAVAAARVGGIVAADRSRGAAVVGRACGASFLVGTALGRGAVAVGRADVKLDGSAFRDIRADGQVDRTVDRDVAAAVDGIVSGGRVGDSDTDIDRILEAAALVRDADDRYGIGA